MNHEAYEKGVLLLDEEKLEEFATHANHVAPGCLQHLTIDDLRELGPRGCEAMWAHVVSYAPPKSAGPLGLGLALLQLFGLLGGLVFLIWMVGR